MKLKFKKLAPGARTPTYATDGSGAFDLYAYLTPGTQHCNPAVPLVVRTQLAFEIPEGHVMLIFSRSGHGFKNNVRLANCVGVIDSDYRGEVMVKLAADDYGFLEVRDGDRIAQGLVLPIPRIEFVEAVSLTDSARGAGGFGSTGQ